MVRVCKALFVLPSDDPLPSVVYVVMSRMMSLLVTASRNLSETLQSSEWGYQVRNQTLRQLRHCVFLTGRLLRQGLTVR